MQAKDIQRFTYVHVPDPGGHWSYRNPALVLHVYTEVIPTPTGEREVVTVEVEEDNGPIRTVQLWAETPVSLATRRARIYDGD
jgi:hypothetical protein